MKFVKANAVLVICGAVVLLALVAIYWPISGVKADVVQRASDRLAAAKSLSSDSVKIEIPYGNSKPFNAPPTQAIIKARQEAQKLIKAQAEEINKMAARDNQRGRVQGPAEAPVPLLNDKPEPYFLPTVDRSKVTPLRFKIDYNRLFPTWVAALSGRSDVHPMPPTGTEVTEAYAATLRNQGVTGNVNANDPAGIEARSNFTLNELGLRAKQLKMYVDDNALLRETSWADSPNEPLPEDIFNAVVECWLQKDIITAINALNESSKSVDTSPIKRLERINIGGDAGMASGFVGGAKGGLFLEPVIATKDAPAPANNGVDATRTLTGHVGGASYDTVLVGITLYMDPAAENKFYDELYRQNNGYTVLNVKTTAVDPFEAASNGFLYGKTQVVRKDILVEALFFRSWLVPLMPQSIREGKSTVGSGSSRPGTAAPTGGGGGGTFTNPVDNQL
jgi:hypothetical protein